MDWLDQGLKANKKISFKWNLLTNGIVALLERVDVIDVTDFTSMLSTTKSEYFKGFLAESYFLVFCC